MHFASCGFGEQLIQILIDPAIIHIGSCPCNSLLDHSRESGSDGSFPLKVFGNLLNDLATASGVAG